MKVSELGRPSDYDPFPNSHLSLGEKRSYAKKIAGRRDNGSESLHLGKCAEITDPIPIKFST